MGLFDSIFGKDKEQKPAPQEIKPVHTTAEKSPETTIDVTIPEKKKASPKPSHPLITNSEYNVLVLWWIAKKKKYDLSSNKYPKWFEKNYWIDFNRVVRAYIDEGLLSEENDIVKITPAGEERMKEQDYIIYVYEHPQYRVTIQDFENNPNLHKVKNADIVWGIFNKRILEAGLNWEDLASIYSDMADLLIEEGRYDDALDLLFGAAFIETSGMKNGNELEAIMQKVSGKKWVNDYSENGMPRFVRLEINNYVVTGPFLAIQNKLDLGWDELRERYINSIHIAALEKSLPFRYFEKEQSFEIFKEAMEDGGKKGIFPLSHCKRNYKWNMPDPNSKKYFYASVDNKMKEWKRKR